MSTLAAARAAFGCGDPSAPLPAPKSDSNYDDPDDPGAAGAEGPKAKPTDGGNDSGPVCAGDRDCVQPLRCFYARSAGCQATGRCMPFAPDACAPVALCTCGHTPLAECAPPGYASSAIDPNGTCGDAGAPKDAGTD